MDSTETNTESTPSFSQPDRILYPFNTLKNIYSPRTVLIVASEHVLKIPDDLKTFTEGENGISVRFTSKLPLPKNDSRPPIDAVALVYKVFDGDSLKTIQNSLPCIDVRYFVGKCFILVTSDVEFQEADLFGIKTLANSYNLPIHFASKVKNSDESGSTYLKVPSRLMSIYCPPIGSDVNSLIIDAAIMRGSSGVNIDSMISRSSAKQV